MTEEPEYRWHWRNCRSLGFGVEFSIWPWHFSVERADDIFGGEAWISFGPLAFVIRYSIGNCSAYAPWCWFALSEIEAAERAAKWESQT